MMVIGKIVGFAFGNRTTSVISTLVILAALLFGWHKIDKSSAVRSAVANYVADVELATARARIDEADRRVRIAEDATSRLQERIQVAEGEAIRAARAVERYEAENEIPSSGRVEPDLFDLLRGN